jgi:hypothetical protein
MAIIPGSVPITGFIAPTDSGDLFATHDEMYGRGGYRTVLNLTERDSITQDRRKVGMLVYVQSDGNIYRLGVGLSNSDWIIYTGSGTAPPETSNQKVYIIAGEGLPAYRVVYVHNNKAYMADKDLISYKHKVLGITTSSALINNNVEIQVSGPIVNSVWDFTSGIVFLNTGGTLTQILPTSGFPMKIGTAITSNTMVLDIDTYDKEYNSILDGGTF